MSELGFNVPPTTRSYGDGTSVSSLIRKTGEAGDRSCDPWIGSLACYPLHHRRSEVNTKYISSNMLKISGISRVRSTSEIADIFNS